MIPFDAAFAARSAEELRRARAGRARSTRRRSRSGRTSASATARRATPSCCAADERFDDARRAAAGGRRRDRLLEPHPRPRARPARWTYADALPRRAVPAARRGRRTATSAGASSASRPRTSCPTTALRLPGPRRLRRPRASGRRRAARRGGQRRRAPDLRDRPRRAGRGLPARLSRATSTASELRLEFLARLRGERRFDSVEALSSRCTRTSSDARDRGAGTPASAVCYRSPPMSTLTQRAQARDRRQVRQGRRGHRLAPRSRSRC